ncbi:MAG TPA: ribose 5-phosphate isomerase A, partial [Algoriphagus sp.]|nr:ribose 5-phosphate isomerase A [Algoriphagus sp.]
KEISNRKEKERIAEKVAHKALDGEIIGAGSGSTSFLTVLALGKRVEAEGISIRIVSTSIEIELAAHAVGLSVISSIDSIIDWCFDGADEVDSANRLIKGRGGALLREKAVFRASKKIILVADASKSVVRLGEKYPVPVEVDPRWVRKVYGDIAKMPNVSEVNLRMAVNKDGPVITEKGNVLLDVRMNKIEDRDEAEFMRMPGVIETGIFSGFEFERIMK